MDSYTDLPASVDALIDLLDSLYPHQCVGRAESMESAQRRAGQRDVVDRLIFLRNNRNSAVLERHARF